MQYLKERNNLEQKIKTVLIEIKVRFLKINDNIKTSSRTLGGGGGGQGGAAVCYKSYFLFIKESVLVNGSMTAVIRGII